MTTHSPLLGKGISNKHLLDCTQHRRGRLLKRAWAGSNTAAVSAMAHAGTIHHGRRLGAPVLNAAAAAGEPIHQAVATTANAPSKQLGSAPASRNG